MAIEDELREFVRREARLDIPEVTLRNWIKRGQLKKTRFMAASNSPTYLNLTSEKKGETK